MTLIRTNTTQAKRTVETPEKRENAGGRGGGLYRYSVGHRAEGLPLGYSGFLDELFHSEYLTLVLPTRHLHNW